MSSINSDWSPECPSGPIQPLTEYIHAGNIRLTGSP